MPRLLGVDIPNEKRIDIALTYIYGVGPAVARKVLKELAISPAMRAKDLKDDEVANLASHLEKNYPVEGALRRHRLEARHLTLEFRRHPGVGLGLQEFHQPPCLTGAVAEFIERSHPVLEDLHFLHHGARPLLVGPEPGITLLRFQRAQTLPLVVQVKENLGVRGDASPGRTGGRSGRTCNT